MENITVITTNGSDVIFDFEHVKIVYREAEILISEIHEVCSERDYCDISFQGHKSYGYNSCYFYTYDETKLSDAISQLKKLNANIIFKHINVKELSSGNNGTNVNTGAASTDSETNFITVFAIIFIILGIIGSIILAAELSNVLLFFAAFIVVMYFGLLLYALGRIITILNRIDKNTRKQ